MSYTPGPWNVCNEGRCKCLQVWCGDFPIATPISGEWGDEYPAIRVEPGIGGKAEAYTARIGYGTVPEEMARANALLIAAAPDLLDACMLAEKYIAAIGIENEDDLTGRTLKVLRAAIEGSAK